MTSTAYSASPAVYTDRWAAVRGRRADVVPVRISLGGPRFIPGAAAFPAITELMPAGRLFSLHGAEFDRRFRDRLDTIGVDAIQARFDELHAEHGGRPLVLCCFEDVTKPGGACHRETFAAWWRDRTGAVILDLQHVELGASGDLHHGQPQPHPEALPGALPGDRGPFPPIPPETGQRRTGRPPDDKPRGEAMSTTRKPRSTTGIRKRHSRSCRSRAGERCNCRASYEAWVYSKRDAKKIYKTFPTEAAAKGWRADAMNALNRGRLRAPKPTTLNQAADGFLRGAREGSIPKRGGGRYKPATIRGYERGLRDHLLPALGHLRLADIARADVQDLADQLTAAGLAASTVQNTLDPLRAIYRRALRRDVVAIDPTEGLELRRPDGRRDRIASPMETVALLTALPDFERVVWATAMYAGLRAGELRALRWSDVDLPGRVIHVRRGWDDVEGEQDGKSEAAERDVPILDPLAKELAAHKLRGGRDGAALVFGLTTEQPFYRSTVNGHAIAAWKAANERRAEDARRCGAEPPAPLEPIGLHEGRHSCASTFIAAGANPKVIQKIMGHASITETFDRYGHLFPGGLDEAAQAANAYLARAVHA
jgi:integrase